MQPNFALVYRQRKDLDAVENILADYVTKREIQVNQNFAKVTQSRDWKRLEQDIDENQKGKVRLLKDVRKAVFPSFKIIT